MSINDLKNKWVTGYRPTQEDYWDMFDVLSSTGSFGITGATGATGIQGIQGATGNLNLSNLTFINSVSDFPSPINNIIYLEPNHTYIITNQVDLITNRLVATGGNSSLVGFNSENCSITSNLNNQALITASGSFPMVDLTLSTTGTNSKFFDLNGYNNQNSVLDWRGLNINGIGSIGTIKDYFGVLIAYMGIRNISDGFIFSGTFTSIAFESSNFVSMNAGGTYVTLDNVTIGRRFRTIYSAYITNDNTALDVRTASVIPNDNYILDTINFSGTGTYTAGIQYFDNRAYFSNVYGVENSASVAQLYMINNTLATTVSSTSSVYKVNGASIPNAINQKFTHVNGRLTYTGGFKKFFKISAIVSLSDGNNQVLAVYVAKNNQILPESEFQVATSGNGRTDNVKTQAITELSNGDYIEIFVQNKTSTTNITVVDLNIIVETVR